jgi:hypothetical protein
MDRYQAGRSFPRTSSAVQEVLSGLAPPIGQSGSVPAAIGPAGTSLVKVGLIALDAIVMGQAPTHVATTRIKAKTKILPNVSVIGSGWLFIALSSARHSVANQLSSSAGLAIGYRSDLT